MTNTSKTAKIIKGDITGNSDGFPLNRGVKQGWGRKIRSFQPITRRISETVQDRTKVITIND